MKSIVCTFFAVLIFITVPNLASAEEYTTYVGFGIGESSFKIADPGSDNFDDTDRSFKIFGGVDINPNFAAEFGYISFGEFRRDYSEPILLIEETEILEAGALFAALKGQANITDQLGLFVKLGLDIWFADYKSDGIVFGIPFVARGDGAGLSVFYGAGINVKVADQVSIRAEWERYNDVGDGVDVTLNIAGFPSIPGELEGIDVDVVGVALAYHF